jgi:hypothetical protein
MLPNHAPLVVAEQFGTLATLFPIELIWFRSCARNRSLYCTKEMNMQQWNFRVILRNYKCISLKEIKMDVFVLPGEGLKSYLILGSSTECLLMAAKRFALFASHFAPAQLQTAISIYRNNFKHRFN